LTKRDRALKAPSRFVFSVNASDFTPIKSYGVWVFAIGGVDMRLKVRAGVPIAQMMQRRIFPSESGEAAQYREELRRKKELAP
jgi:hypothetical protein